MLASSIRCVWRWSPPPRQRSQEKCGCSPLACEGSLQSPPWACWVTSSKNRFSCPQWLPTQSRHSRFRSSQPVGSSLRLSPPCLTSRSATDCAFFRIYRIRLRLANRLFDQLRFAVPGYAPRYRLLSSLARSLSWCWYIDAAVLMPGCFRCRLLTGRQVGHWFPLAWLLCRLCPAFVSLREDFSRNRL